MGRQKNFRKGGANICPAIQSAAVLPAEDGVCRDSHRGRRHLFGFHLREGRRASASPPAYQRAEHSSNAIGDLCKSRSAEHLLGTKKYLFGNRVLCIPARLHPQNCMLQQLIRILEIQFLLDARAIGLNRPHIQMQIIRDLARVVPLAQHLKHAQFPI